MNDNTLIFVGIIWLLCGFAAGAIAQSRGSSFGAFFFIGLILGIIGVIIAACVQRPAPKPPGWYQDPWTPGHIRYFDGRQWTYYTQPMTSV